MLPRCAGECFPVLESVTRTNPKTRIAAAQIRSLWRRSEAGHPERPGISPAICRHCCQRETADIWKLLSGERFWLLRREIDAGDHLRWRRGLLGNRVRAGIECIPRSAGQRVGLNSRRVRLAGREIP